MAVINDYQTGTVSVAAGGTAVTGVGTAWQTAGVQAGDLLMRAGLAVPIAAVNSDTSLTLAENWPGAALNNSAYRIRFQPDGSRYTAAARALIELLANGKVEAFAALAGAADRLPYFTGANTLGLATFSAFARTLLDDANAAAAYATLGQVPDAQLKGQLRDVIPNTVNVDLNTILASGLYFVSGTVSNAPAGELNGYLEVMTYNANSVQQRFYRSNGRRAWQRFFWFNGGVFSPWVETDPDFGYEGGTFTPGLSFNNLTTGIAYGGQAGNYVRFGQLVLFGFQITLTNKGTAIGQARVTGLPFTASGHAAEINIGPYSAMVGLASPSGYVGATTTTVVLTLQTATGSVGGMTDAHFSNTSVLRGTGVYFAA